MYFVHLMCCLNWRFCLAVGPDFSCPNHQSSSIKWCFVWGFLSWFLWVKGALSAKQTFLSKLFLSRNKEEFSHFSMSSVAVVAHPHQPLPSTACSVLPLAPAMNVQIRFCQTKGVFLPHQFPSLSEEPPVPAPCWQRTGSVTGGCGPGMVEGRGSSACAGAALLRSVRTRPRLGMNLNSMKYLKPVPKIV